MMEQNLPWWKALLYLAGITISVFLIFFVLNALIEFDLNLSLPLFIYFLTFALTNFLIVFGVTKYPDLRPYVLVLIVALGLHFVISLLFTFQISFSSEDYVMKYYISPLVALFISLFFGKYLSWKTGLIVSFASFIILGYSNYMTSVTITLYSPGYSVIKSNSKFDTNYARNILILVLLVPFLVAGGFHSLLHLFRKKN